MAVTRHVTRAKRDQIPEGNDPRRIEILSDGKGGLGKGESMPVPEEHIFVVTKPVNFEQLSNEMEQSLGSAVALAAYQDTPRPEPVSREHPVTIYVSCDDGRPDTAKTIASLLDAHQADSNWRHPSLEAG